MRYIHDPQKLFKSGLKLGGRVGSFEENILVYPDVEAVANRDFHGGLGAQVLARNFRAQFSQLLADGTGRRLSRGGSREQGRVVPLRQFDSGRKHTCEQRGSN
jgi:hypothetical protein